MCELYGFNFDNPVPVRNLGLPEFFARGGGTGNHRHGWGFAAHTTPRSAVLYKDAHPAATSQLAKHLATENNQIWTAIGLAHIRYATNGGINTGNAHPFQRELWGVDWVMAHNGVVSGTDALIRVGDRFHPTGATDSEHMFCHLLNVLAANFSAMPDRFDQVTQHKMAELIARTTASASRSGNFNMLLSNGQTLYARRDTRLAMSKVVVPTGSTSETVSGYLVATQPTNTGSHWDLGLTGMLWTFRAGELIETLPS